MKGKPVTLEDVADRLKVSKSKVKRAVKALISREIISLDELPDKKYLRLKRRDIRFYGSNPTQEQKIKKKKSRRGKKEKDRGSKKSRDMMYG